MPAPDGPSPAHVRPAGVSDATVEAVGRLTEALERVERARGHLYEAHQLIGGADGMAQDAVGKLRAAGHGELADRLDRDLVGRNMAPGRWTFQLVEEFDDGYWEPFRALEATVRDELVGGRRHLYEAELKERTRSPGVPGHDVTPPEAGMSSNG